MSISILFVVAAVVAVVAAAAVVAMLLLLVLFQQLQLFVKQSGITVTSPWLLSIGFRRHNKIEITAMLLLFVADASYC